MIGISILFKWKSFDLGAFQTSEFQKLLHKLHSCPWIIPSIRDISSELWISKFSSTIVKSLLSLKILQSGGIFDLWISKFSSTMVKSFTLVIENPSIWGHFWTYNNNIFFNHGKVIHFVSQLWNAYCLQQCFDIVLSPLGIPCRLDFCVLQKLWKTPNFRLQIPPKNPKSKVKN